jgi:hypothetical protein
MFPDGFTDVLRLAAKPSFAGTSIHPMARCHRSSSLQRLLTSLGLALPLLA